MLLFQAGEEKTSGVENSRIVAIKHGSSSQKGVDLNPRGNQNSPMKRIIYQAAWKPKNEPQTSTAIISLC